MLQNVRSWLATGHRFVEELPERQQIGLVVVLCGFALICLLFHKLLAMLVLLCGVLAAVAVAYIFATQGAFETEPEDEPETE
jgi:hypothetical protein